MVGIIDYIIESLIGISGEVWIFALMFLFVVSTLMIIYKISINEAWAFLLPSLAALTPRFGGSWLPEWVIVVAFIPFGMLISEVIIRRWEGQRE